MEYRGNKHSLEKRIALKEELLIYTAGHAGSLGKTNW